MPHRRLHLQSLTALATASAFLISTNSPATSPQFPPSSIPPSTLLPLVHPSPSLTKAPSESLARVFLAWRLGGTALTHDAHEELAAHWARAALEDPRTAARSGVRLSRGRLVWIGDVVEDVVEVARGADDDGDVADADVVFGPESLVEGVREARHRRGSDQSETRGKDRGGGVASVIADAAARDQSVAEQMVQVGGVQALRILVDMVDGDFRRQGRVQSEVARALANLTVTRAGQKEAAEDDYGWRALLGKWAADPHTDYAHLQAQAKRALCNLDQAAGARLFDGHLVLSNEEDADDAEIDVVFLHGLRGDPVLTWRTQMAIDPDNLVIWPRDWLQYDAPTARVHSIGYSVGLSQWSPARNISLSDHAAECLESLVAAGLGDRPICFIAHSFGGLIAKRLHLLARECAPASRERAIADATRGFVFFGTPHRGSPITRAVRGKVVGSAFRPSSAVVQLFPGCESLRELDEEFRESAAERRMDVTSVAEGRPTALAQFKGRALERWLVPPETADAGVGRFVTVQGANHPELCKPPDPLDVRYRIVLEMLARVVGVEHGDEAKGPGMAARLSMA